MLNRSIAHNRRLTWPRIAPVAGACALFAMAGYSPLAKAEVPVPVSYSSDPGAAYTLYLDFGGFTINKWAGGSMPGTTPAFDENGDPTSFSSQELSDIQQIWSRVAAIYAPFNVNVTTVDPAIAAGQATNDTTREEYYDNQAGIEHTIIGGNGDWPGAPGGGEGGLSEEGVMPYSDPVFGGHANFVFTSESSDATIALTIAHEDGHALNLEHQGDYSSGLTEINEVSAGTGTGPGSVAPIMGGAAYEGAQRGLFAIGASIGNTGGGYGSPGIIQNDDQIIANDPGEGGFSNDGIGHTRASATPLPTVGNSVDFNLAKGVIVPVSSSNPAAAGSASYQPDYWSFTTSGGLVSLTANSGGELITPGTADPGATLKTLLTIYDSAGDVVDTSPTTSLSETISTTLAAGTYYASVTAVGDAVDNTYYPRYFFDQGPFFLTGTVPAVPEPSAVGIALCGVLPMLLRRQRSSPTAG